MPDRMRTDSQPDSAEGAARRAVPGACLYSSAFLMAFALAVAGVQDLRCVLLLLGCWGAWALALAAPDRTLPEEAAWRVRASEERWQRVLARRKAGGR